MAPQQHPTLVLLAGPNGAGKTTLYDTQVAPCFPGPFVNADIIQRDELGDGDLNSPYRAAEIAAERRAAFLEDRRSFVAESVFSHPSKLDFINRAKDLNYRIIVFHVCVENPGVSVARVAARVKEGGHPVPEHKIRERYERNGPLIRQAVLLSDVGRVFDNSTLNEAPTQLMSFRRGTLTSVVPKLPGWAREIYKDDIARKTAARSLLLIPPPRES